MMRLAPSDIGYISTIRGQSILARIDRCMTPQRLEQRVGEAQRQQVLYRFLAQVMIDSKDLVLFKYAGQLIVYLKI